MDEIEMLTRMIPIEVRNAVMTLIRGSDVEIELLLPLQLNSIKEIATSARVLATESVDHFNKTSLILKEIILGGTTTESMSKQEVAKLNIKIQKEKAREEEYTNIKQELEKTKEVIKQQLEKSQADFDKALKDLPSGWKIIAMDFTEALAKSTARFVDGITSALTFRKPGGNSGSDKVGVGPENITQAEAFEEYLDLPKCNKKENTDDTTTDVNDKKKMEKVDALRAATEYVTALTDLDRVESILTEFNENMFVLNKEEEMSLKKDGEKDVLFLKKSTSKPKELIDSDSNIPKYMKKGLALFYKNIHELADKIQSNLSKNVSKENITKLEKEMKELMDTSSCFNTWAKGAIKIPAMDTPLPFSTKNAEPSNLKRASQIATENAQMKVKMYEHQVESTQKRNEYNSIRLLETTNELRDAIHKLNEFNGATATLKEIISQLQEALETLHTLREKWLEILEFFQKMELMIDTSMGKFNDVAKYIEQGRDIKVREPLSPDFKNIIYRKIQMAMTSAYLVNRMSAVYVDISAEYIMPPVRKLGIMMETKDPNEITKLKIQIKEQAEKANAKITTTIKEEKRNFDSAVKKRLADIEAFYKPVFDQIPQARKSELEALSEETTNAISEVALIYV